MCDSRRRKLRVSVTVNLTFWAPILHCSRGILQVETGNYRWKYKQIESLIIAKGEGSGGGYNAILRFADIFNKDNLWCPFQETSRPSRGKAQL